MSVAASRPSPIPLAASAWLVIFLLLTSGCSIKRIAIGSIANTLAESGDTFAADDDPELVRDAVPFSLKLMESMLAEVPEHRGLLLSACSSFTQYAYAFIETDAALVRLDDFERSEVLNDRARRMFLRARNYGLRNLEVAYPGIRARLAKDPAHALGATKLEDVASLYWTGAAWGSAVSLGLDRPDHIVDLPAARALLERALALDEAFQHGAIHEAFISLDAVPEAMGGSMARARQHFARALELSEGRSAGTYVSLATNVSLNEQNRAEFEELLTKALAVDRDAEPGLRLANIIAQRRARYLLDHIDEFFANRP